MVQPQTRQAKIALFAAAALLALATAEFAARYVLFTAPLLDLPIYRRDTQGNLLLRPGLRRRHVTRHWDVTVATNEQGWRDSGDPTPSAGTTLLGLGDSFAFGWGVELEESLLFLVEKRLSRVRATRFVKAGVPGTGPSDQWKLLPALWERYRPSIVVLVFFVGNDFTDVQMGGSSQFEVRDGYLRRRPLPDQPYSWLQDVSWAMARYSRLLQWLRAAQSNWARSESNSAASPNSLPTEWDAWRREFTQVHLQSYPERTERAVHLTLDYLGRLSDFCRARSTVFALVVVPRSYQVYPEEFVELKSALELTDGELDLDRPQRILREWAQQREVLILDLLPWFRRSVGVEPNKHLFYYPDAHLNPAGHRVAAEALYSFLTETKLTRAALTYHGSGH